jgi:hypothetical protein
MTIFFLFILPGLVALYALVLRPLLARIPAFAKFYSDANGFWAKVWAWCGNSLTILWGKALGGLGLALALLDPIADAVGDPGFKDQMTGFLQGNPQVMGYVLMGISAITIAARVRSIIKEV